MSLPADNGIPKTNGEFTFSTIRGNVKSGASTVREILTMRSLSKDYMDVVDNWSFETWCRILNDTNLTYAFGSGNYYVIGQALKARDWYSENKEYYLTEHKGQQPVVEIYGFSYGFVRNLNFPKIDDVMIDFGFENARVMVYGREFNSLTYSCDQLRYGRIIELLTKAPNIERLNRGLEFLLYNVSQKLQGFIEEIIKVLDLMIMKGVDIKPALWYFINGMTLLPFITAGAGGNKESNIFLIKYLVSKGADPNHHGADQFFTPLEKSFGGLKEITETLLNLGANIVRNFQVGWGSEEVVMKYLKINDGPDYNIVKLMLDKGFPMDNAVNSYMEKLTDDMISENFRILTFLFERDGDNIIRDYISGNLFITKSRRAMAIFIEEMKKRNVNLFSIKNEEGRTLLQEYIKRNNVEIVELLIDNGADTS